MTVAPEPRAPDIQLCDERRIPIVEFNNKWETQPYPAELTWRELVDKLSHHIETRNKENVSMWSPAIFKPGTTRAKVNVAKVTALVGDVDHTEIPPERLAPFEYLKISSYSNTPDDPHLRYILPVTRHIDAAEYAHMWLRFKTLLPEIDPQCKDQSRGYWNPSVPPGGQGVVEYHPGRWLNPDELPEVPEPPKPSTPRRIATKASDAEDRRKFARWTADYVNARVAELASMAPNTGRNAAANRIAYTLAGLAADPRHNLEPGELTDVLLDACRSNGLVDDTSERQCIATIRSGLESGQGRPWSPGDQDDDAWQPSAPLRVVNVGQRRTLKDIEPIFKKWLYLNDLGAVYVTLATIAANRVEGDPLWVMLVGGSGWGKTEILRSTVGLPHIHSASTVTEGALLSGTPKKDRDAAAKGGLLRQIGEYGVLILKDFTSILSMGRDPRKQVLSALREIYDGSWKRHVGVDGGRELTWEGKLGMVAGCTTAIDTHHAVIALMGERFVLYRLGEVNAHEQARQALANTGHEAEMREELATAVADLFDTLDIQADAELPPLEPADTERLIALADLASRCRSAVDRDGYTHEVELIADPEAPARLAQMLRRLYGGLMLIGVEREEAWKHVLKTGLDSMPKLRRGVFDVLANLKDDERTDSATVATAMGYPTVTARRSLEDLAAHGVVGRVGSQGQADRWALTQWAREMFVAAAGQPPTEKSLPIYRGAHTLSPDPIHTCNDISVGGPEERGQDVEVCAGCGLPADTEKGDIVLVNGVPLHQYGDRNCVVAP